VIFTEKRKNAMARWNNTPKELRQRYVDEDWVHIEGKLESTLTGREIENLLGRRNDKQKKMRGEL
jgi:hypothetical protein